jgi:hypothetical protein
MNDALSECILLNSLFITSDKKILIYLLFFNHLFPFLGHFFLFDDEVL